MYTGFRSDSHLATTPCSLDECWSSSVISEWRNSSHVVGCGSQYFSVTFCDYCAVASAAGETQDHNYIPSALCSAYIEPKQLLCQPSDFKRRGKRPWLQSHIHFSVYMCMCVCGERFSPILSPMGDLGFDPTPNYPWDSGAFPPCIEAAFQRAILAATGVVDLQNHPHTCTHPSGNEPHVYIFH